MTWLWRRRKSCEVSFIRALSLTYFLSETILWFRFWFGNLQQCFCCCFQATWSCKNPCLLGPSLSTLTFILTHQMCIFQLPPPFHLLFGFQLILNTLPQVASCMSEFESLGKLNCESGCEFVYEVEYVAPIVTYCRFCQLFTSSMNCLLRLLHKQAGHARPTF